MTFEHEALVATLEATGNYKVLRRLDLAPQIYEPAAGPLRRALILDVETTGLDPVGANEAPDEIIEFAAVPISITTDGRIAEIYPAFHRLREPTKPLTEKIVQLTGLTPELVRGHTINPSDVTALLSDVDLVIAHNARFDRPFAERLCADFIALPWACSQTQVPWLEHGHEGTKLAYLLAACGMFHDPHQGIADCFALAEILRRPLGLCGRTALSYLLEAAFQPMIRIFAEGAHYDLKEALRQRGYRWSPGSRGAPRSWYRDCSDEDAGAETEWLRRAILPPGRQPLVVRIDARDRFSERV